MDNIADIFLRNQGPALAGLIGGTLVGALFVEKIMPKSKNKELTVVIIALLASASTVHYSETQKKFKK